MERHIHFDEQAMRLELLDQTLLPDRQAVFICKTADDVIYAIKSMVVRGAPAIGVAAAWGCVLAAATLNANPEAVQKLKIKMAEIAAARPTAINLEWAIRRMEKRLESLESADILADLLAEARAIQEEDEQICRLIGKYGAELIGDGDTVLTYCNAGGLATAGYGTALGVIRTAASQGKDVRVLACETRPLLQGARLTAFELARDGIPVSLICDNACAHVMASRKVQLALTGADHIAANGDTANKIGTSGIAIIAKAFNIPFYIAAPVSSINLRIASGREIPIEERAGEEIVEFAGRRVAPDGVSALNFAFDITPASYISGIVTEKGILTQPYEQSIKRLFADNEETGHML